MDKSEVKSGYFVTYTSASWIKDVALTFMGGDNGGKGMMIQFDKEYKADRSVYCCDVSWVSKFPDECEILFARSLTWVSWDDWSGQTADNEFECIVVDQKSGIQTIALNKKV